MQAADVREWQLVCEEVGRFIAADEPIQRPGLPQRVAAALSLRCLPASPLASVPYTAPFLRLQVICVRHPSVRGVSRACAAGVLHLQGRRARRLEGSSCTRRLSCASAAARTFFILPRTAAAFS